MTDLAFEIAAAAKARWEANPSSPGSSLTRLEAYALAHYAIGREHTHTNQPHGSSRLLISHATPREFAPGRWTVDIGGAVIDGHEVASLWGQRSSKSTAGTYLAVWSVRPLEIAEGLSIRAYCG